MKHKFTLLNTIAFLFCFISINSVQAQYCPPLYGNGCTFDDDINSFTLNGAGASTISDLNTGCSANGYDDRTAIVAAVNLQQGGTYAGTITTDYTSDEYVRIWIDFNNDQVFSSTEQVAAFGPFGVSNGNFPFSINLPFSAPVANGRRMRVRMAYNQNPANSIDPCTSYSFGETHDYLVNILLTPPCAGMPTAGTVNPAGPVSGCAGNTYNLTTTGTTFATGLIYQWEQSTNGGVTWGNAIGGVGATTLFYTTPSLVATTWYRLKVSCGASTATTAPLIINITPPTYATLPYVEGFESWLSYCDNLDVPTLSWLNTPKNGDQSWRRDDQGNTANWSSTGGGYSPASMAGSHSARFHTWDANFGSTGTLDLFVNCSAAGNKELQFFYINPFGSDQLEVLISTNGGASFTTLNSYFNASSWTFNSINLTTTSAQTVIRFKATSDFSDDIGIDEVKVLLPCSGTPTAGTITPAGPISGCAGSTYTLTTTGGTQAAGLTYQWEQSINGGVTWVNAIGGVGATTLYYTTPGLNVTTWYRLNVYCGIFPAVTAPVIINIAAPPYAALPLVESFENWINYCDNLDVPTLSWLNVPKNGDESWRRDDQGNTANWSSTGGGYTPVSAVGNHSARFHTWDANFNSTGQLDVFVNCSAPGNKELQFFYINPSGSDQLEVLLSTDGGANFTTLTSYFTATSWTFNSINLTTTSAQTVIRFKATSDFSDDMGIDDVKVLPPCSGKPDAGTVNLLTPCSGVNFNLSLSGSSSAAALTYLWQQSTNNITWTNVPGGTSYISQTSITTPTYFRAIVTCTMSTLEDTTPSVLFNIASFYYCYCQSSAQFDFDEDIGNVTIKTSPQGVTLLNNGIASPLTFNPAATNVYTDFTSLPPTPLYKLSPYTYSVTQIDESFFYNSYVAVYVDYNGNGIFDPLEQVLLQATSSSSNPPQQVNTVYTIPDSPFVGITGMRVVLVDGTFQLPDPCGNYFAGETEDYLVEINYPKCTGTPDAGLAHISDTLLCVGDTAVLIDTTHVKKLSGLVTVWESSADGSNWAAIPNSTDKDTFAAVIPGEVYYRFKVSCTFANTNSTSNVMHVSIKAPYKCYCKSFANGGANDASDVSAFSIGNFITNSGGPHLSNTTAIRSYTDYTDNGAAILFTDSTYYVSVYHTLKGAIQIDAKVTMFIDYNNNWQYDIPDERVWTGYADLANVYINTNVTIPHNAVTDVITGMRVIINNNLAPSVPSDDACGPYTSGETEDYIVLIKNKYTSIGNIPSLQNLIVYPNPTEGNCTVAFNTKQLLKDVQLSVTNITGQQVQSFDYHDLNGQFQKNIDLGNEAKGVYFIEIKADGERVVRKVVVR